MSDVPITDAEQEFLALNNAAEIVKTVDATVTCEFCGKIKWTRIYTHTRTGEKTKFGGNDACPH